MTNSPPPSHLDLTNDQRAAINTTLRSGIEQKNGVLIELALKLGADPNILMFAGIARRIPGIDIFLRAPDDGLEWVKLAIAHGADVNAVNPDDTDGKGRPYSAIHCALHHYGDHGSRTEITSLLIASGASVDTPSPSGNTPLKLAVTRGQPQLVEYYLLKGADPMRPCENGDVPLQNLLESTRFKEHKKAKLLAIMIKSISEHRNAAPPKAATSPAPSQEIAVSHDVIIQKPFNLKPPSGKPPRIRLNL